LKNVLIFEKTGRTDAQNIRWVCADPYSTPHMVLTDPKARRESQSTIEVLNVNPRHKKAIILLLYRTDVKVLKDALAHLGPYQTLTSVRYNDPYGENTVLLPATIQI
jgi:hypothetical protein